MSKKLDLSKAADWDDDEAWDNVRYLEDRLKFKEAAQVREAQGFPAKGYPVDTNTVQPDPHQSVSSSTGTNDSPEKAGEGTPTGSGAAGQGDVGPHGPNADQFKPGDGDGDSGDGEEVEEGSAEWVRKSTVDTVVSWVEDAESEDSAKDRAKFALEADHPDNGGKDRSTLKEELEDFVKDE